MKHHRGLAFPDADQFMVQALDQHGTYQVEHLQAALRFVTEYGCAIDGGAHVGTWSRVLSRHFARVIAVEPSPDTFACLELNLFDATNVECRAVALGSAPQTVSMALDAENAKRANTGARHVCAGGSIPVETIDSWRLDRVGFIKLDIEGSEPAALRGAKDTLRRCRPIVLYEDKGLWKRHYGLPRNAVSTFLTAHGYRELARVSSDAIWGPTR